MTLIQNLGYYKGNHLWIKREDLLPFSFGGNKARKAEFFFRDIEKNKSDCVVTYGSSSSNHCRVIANECCRRGLDCYIISPKEASESSFNRKMMELFGARIITVSIDEVHDSIEKKLSNLKEKGKNPYFIQGGGHGNIGTEAYVQCYQEIKEYEHNESIHFDYVFLASGTGTTQAGLVCGQLDNKDERKIVGISIARKNPRGRDVVIESVQDYLGNRLKYDEIQNATIFLDSFTNGYNIEDERVNQTIDYVLRKYGIPLDTIYTGKAFMGMTEYLRTIQSKNVLFLHTGGTPLFFDELRRRM